MLIVFAAAVEPAVFDIPSSNEVVAPEFKVKLLLFMIAFAEVATPIKIPLKVET